MTRIRPDLSTSKHKLNCIRETVTISRVEGGIALVRRTLEDVALTAGVSVAAVDRVINRRPADRAETAQRIRIEISVSDNDP